AGCIRPSTLRTWIPRFFLLASLVAVSTIFAPYFSETALQFFYVPSITATPVAPDARQHHRKSECDVSYRYNNVSFRGADFDPSHLYDLTLLGDSFFVARVLLEHFNRVRTLTSSR